MIEGLLGFIKTALLIFIIMELSLLLEEYFSSKVELKKGFAGAKSNVLKTFNRHLLKVLRMEGFLKNHLSTAARCLFLFLAAGLLPTWGGEINLETPHSLWVFLGLGIAAPAFALILQWTAKKGLGWPFVLNYAERSIGSATVLFILAITLVAMTGADSFSEITKIQSTHGWLVYQYPLSGLLMLALIVINLFLAFQTMFARAHEDSKPEGWTLDDLLPDLRRSIWSLFIVDVFLGASVGGLDDLFLIIKCVTLNVVAEIFSQLFIRLREDQAEAFILWKFAPLSILILGLSLFFPGGCT